jgi:hypothetical protein
MAEPMPRSWTTLARRATECTHRFVQRTACLIEACSAASTTARVLGIHDRSEVGELRSPDERLSAGRLCFSR